jgi:type III restriction enzyme
VEAQRDALAQGVFDELVTAGRIEFRLRADRTDYELPREAEVASAAAPEALIRPDGRPAEKSLLEPALKLPGDNRLELDFACYLDGQAALRWWHRNVAKTQYGLQGWRRDKVYPDFVFARVTAGERNEFVVMETKGLQLAGSADTAYKQALLARLSTAFRDERLTRAGEFAFEGDGERVVCDLVIDEAWQGRVDARYFADA